MTTPRMAHGAGRFRPATEAAAAGGKLAADWRQNLFPPQGVGVAGRNIEIIYHVFTLSGGKVIRWRDYLTRREALEAAGTDGPHWR